MRQCAAVNAISPPAANSQARVGSEKNAHGGIVCVQASATHSEAPATTASTPAYGAADRLSRPVRVNSHAMPTIRAGHSR